MKSFKKDKIELPLGIVWLLNAISEYKGRQNLYLEQTPELFKSLLEMAMIESVESSNRIEGITVSEERLKSLLLQNSKPLDRSEEEIAGYRKALDWIHNNYASIKISPESIQQIHKLCCPEAWDSGKWKEKDNDIIRKFPNGEMEIVYRPLSAKETPHAIDQLCLAYEYAINQDKYPPLFAIGCLILDFLCIHPFRDGNGRVSRLLTLLTLYQHDFIVGKFISIERIIEQTKETYYEALNKSSQNWDKSEHDIFPWIFYFLGTILSAYREFADRAEIIKKT